MPHLFVARPRLHDLMHNDPSNPDASALSHTEMA